MDRTPRAVPYPSLSWSSWTVARAKAGGWPALQFRAAIRAERPRASASLLRRRQPTFPRSPGRLRAPTWAGRASRRPAVPRGNSRKSSWPPAAARPPHGGQRRPGRTVRQAFRGARRGKGGVPIQMLREEIGRPRRPHQI